MTARAPLTVTLTADTRAVTRVTKALRAELDRLVQLRQGLTDLFLGGTDLLIELPSVDSNKRRARRAGELTIRPQPTNELLAVLVALRTFNRDLDAIHGRLKVKHDGTSGAVTGELKRPKHRAGGGRRQGGRR